MYTSPQPSRQLTRSSSGVIAGVCAGLSAYFGISLAFVRLVFCVLTLASGISILLYIMLIFIIPAEQDQLRDGGATLSGGGTYLPRVTQKRTVFAYIAGTVAALAAIVTFISNLNVVVAFVISLLGVPAQDAQSPIPITPLRPSLNGVYEGVIAADNQPNLAITRITITDMQTVIDLRYQQPREEAAAFISVAPPGDPHAFFISNPDGTRIYRLRAVTGIEPQQNRRRVLPGESVDITLTFERIDDQLTEFALIEGFIDDPDMTEWIFSGIVLRQN
jgi:phage shock protein PspC (stress-responsive transcriptional regulator)